MKLVPLSDSVVLKQIEAEETTASGIILTSQAKEKPQQAEVIAVGPGGIVDGEKVEITPVGNSLLAFPLEAGEHEIKLTYYPNGFWPGFAISMICAFLFAGACVLTYVLKKKIIPDPVYKSQIGGMDEYQK